LRRVRPLAARNAVSKKELDDAIGIERSSRAAVLAAEGEVRTARLNLGYTTISSPLQGLSSFSKKQEGSYLTVGEQGLLTTVSQVDPIWVNFSISENELLSYRDQIAKGRLKFPRNNDFEVEVVLADGTVFPKRGRINFAEPSFNSDTGTFLVRTELPNPQGQLRPGQFVRARVFGASRPQALQLPQRAVQQGAKGHYVWVIGNRRQGQAARGGSGRLDRRRLVHQRRPEAGRARRGRRRRPGHAHRAAARGGAGAGAGPGASQRGRPPTAARAETRP
jgi:membrane fusion protein (multidrug efflux system)